MESQKIGDSMYHIARVKIAHPSQLRTALAGPYGAKKTAKTSVIAAEHNAVVAINGDYFQYRGGGAPRVGIGQIGPLEYVLVVVDGRQEGYSRGISIKKLAEFMGELGCQQTFNLDGGGSATMVFGGKYFNNVSGNSERNISDIIYFASAVPESVWQDAGEQE